MAIPVLDTPLANVILGVGKVGTIDFGAGFSDPEGNTLTFSILPDISSLTGWTFNTSTGIASFDGNQVEAVAVTYTVTADDGNAEGTMPTDVVDVTVISVCNLKSATIDLSLWTAGSVSKVRGNDKGGLL